MEGLTADLIPQPSTTTGTTGNNFNYPSDVTYVSDESVHRVALFLTVTHSAYSTSCRSNRNPMSSFSGTGRSRNSIP